jgi:hypothetical protein
MTKWKIKTDEGRAYSVTKYSYYFCERYAVRRKVWYGEELVENDLKEFKDALAFINRDGSKSYVGLKTIEKEFV